MKEDVYYQSEWKGEFVKHTQLGWFLLIQYTLITSGQDYQSDFDLE